MCVWHAVVCVLFGVAVALLSVSLIPDTADDTDVDELEALLYNLIAAKKACQAQPMKSRMAPSAFAPEPEPPE